MSTLHTINKSSFSSNVLASCLQICAKKDAVLLLEDGVFSAITGAPCSMELQQLAAHGIKIFVLANDLSARGLDKKIQPNIVPIDYTRFVQLSIEHDRVQSWY